MILDEKQIKEAIEAWKRIEKQSNIDLAQSTIYVKALEQELSYLKETETEKETSKDS